MGTEKRERQKANRQLRLEEIAKEQVKQKTKRRFLRIGLLVAGVIALVGIVYLTSKDSKNEDQALTTTIPALVDPVITLDPNEIPISIDPAASVDPVITLDPNESVVDPVITLDPNESPETTAAREPFTYGKGECPADDGSAKKSQEFTDAPQLCIDPAKKYIATVETNMGTYTAELDPSIAPGTVNNFVTLARYHYFDDVKCHRAIPGFMVQCGDPTGTGSGDPGYSFADELPAAGEYKLGSLVMANAGPDTNGSQFFVITGEQGVSLPPQYALFGQVTEGFDTTVKAMDEAGNPASNGVPPLKEIKILKVTIDEGLSR